MNKGKSKNSQFKETNGFDFLISIGSGIANLLKFEKIIGIIILYLVYRDYIFIHRLPPGTDYQSFLIDTKLIEKVFESNSNTVIILSSVIVVLFVIIFLLILSIKFIYKKEIDRLSEERSLLLHNIQNKDFTPIKEHKTSKQLVNLKQEV